MECNQHKLLKTMKAIPHIDGNGTIENNRAISCLRAEVRAIMGPQTDRPSMP